MRLQLFRQDVALTRPVRASQHVHRERSRLFLGVEDQGVVGYGEVAPQPVALNGDPGVEEVLSALDDLLSLVAGIDSREGRLPSWRRVVALSSGTPASKVACALVEMALLDRELRVTNRSIEAEWPARFDTPVQMTFSLLDDVEWRVDERAQRARVKSAPGTVSARALERLARLRVPVIVDFNCSASDDLDVVNQLDQIRRVAAVAAVEQPFAAGNVVDHARLAERLDVPISIDEGVRSLRDLQDIARYRAGEIVCVKPARVGGLANARALFVRASEWGLRAYLGGFFESPYARYVHRLLARSCVSEPSDLADVDVEGLDDAPCLTPVSWSFGVEPSAELLHGARALPLLF